MAVVADAGEPLSPQAADLIRRIARVVLDEPADLMDQVHAAVLAAADEPLRSEPVLAAEVAASTRANMLHWAASMLKDPGGRVPANLTPEVLGIAREAFRRGIEQTVYTTYRTGQNIVWAYWMRTAFALSQDPAVLRQALEAGSRSVAGFVDDMVAALSEQLRRERADLARGSPARRFEVVSLILDSAPITAGRASTRLGYDLRGRHTAAVLWTDPRRPDQAALAAAAAALGPATRARQVLTVIASSSSVISCGCDPSGHTSPAPSIVLSPFRVTRTLPRITRTWTPIDCMDCSRRRLSASAWSRTRCVWPGPSGPTLQVIWTAEPESVRRIRMKRSQSSVAPRIMNPAPPGVGWKR